MSGWRRVFVTHKKLLSSKSPIICFELLHCYQKGRQRPVWGGIRSVCPKTRTGILQSGGTMGKKKWRLTGWGSCGWIWLTAVSYVWPAVDFCLVESSVDCLAPRSARRRFLVKTHLLPAASTRLISIFSLRRFAFTTLQTASGRRWKFDKVSPVKSAMRWRFCADSL